MNFKTQEHVLEPRPETPAALKKADIAPSIQESIRSFIEECLNKVQKDREVLMFGNVSFNLQNKNKKDDGGSSDPIFTEATISVPPRDFVNQLDAMITKKIARKFYRLGLPLDASYSVFDLKLDVKVFPYDSEYDTTIQDEISRESSTKPLQEFTKFFD